MRVAIILFFVFVSANLFAQQKLFVHQSGNELYVEHKVAPKENWYSVGRIYFISPKEIAAFNLLSLDKGLGIGQLLKIPLREENFSQSSTMIPAGAKVFHQVKPKEGLLKVANLYQIDKGLLKKWNGLASDQINAGTQLTIGFLFPKTVVAAVTSASGPVTGTAISPTAGNEKLVKSDQVAEEKTPKEISTSAVVLTVPEEKRMSSPAAAPAKVAGAIVAAPEKTAEPKQTVAVDARKSSKSFFASLFDQQSKEGQQQKLENSVYGVFKSTSGWQDGKYYVLMNNVVPGTVVKLVIRSTDKFLFAKVLGAVPPGKESEGMTLRMSNSTVAALGLPDSGSGVDLLWFN